MRVLRISSLFGDRKVFFEAANPGSTPIIRTKALSDLGRVHVIPSVNCTDDCYVGLSFIIITFKVYKISYFENKFDSFI